MATASNKSSSSKSAAKANATKANAVKAAKAKERMESAVANINPNPNDLTDNTPSRMVPAIIPNGEGFTLAGPLARREIAEQLAEDALELGVAVQTSDTGVVMAPEERTGADRRQTERRHSDPMAQFVSQQLTTPVVGEAANNNAPEAAEAEAETNAEVAKDAVAATNPPAQPTVPAGFQEALAALQQQFGIAVAPVLPSGVVAGRPGRDTKNNITRPGPGTKTGFIWQKADEITAANKGQPCSVDQLRTHPEVRSFNDHTIRTQYARWRQYNGVVGRVATPSQFQAAAPVAQQAQAPQFQKGPPAIDTSNIGAMADQVYQNFLNMKKNNTLPDYLEPILAAETARRDAEGAQHTQA
jgi:hypothetical protein